jgi:DNA repair exonuclease SbcCD ATPase subunit
MQLLFNELIVKNFGCFVGEHSFLLKRTPGLYFISGNNVAEPSLTTNGCGKSTLFNALFWCLTGKTLRVQRPGASIESWHSKGTVSVTLELEIERIHHITRTRKPNTLTLDGRTVDQAIINDLLKLNEETLKRTIIVGQFAPMFLDLRPEQQSALFSEALNLDLWLTASDRAATEHKRCETQINKHELAKAALIGRHDQLHDQYTLEVEREKTYAENHKRQISEVRHALAVASRDIDAAAAALRAATDARNSETATGVAATELQRVRSLERTLSREQIETVASVRAMRRELDLVTTNLKRYQSTKEVCPECHQVVNEAHIKSKISQLIQQHGELLEDVGRAEKSSNVIAEKLIKCRKDIAHIEEQTAHEHAQQEAAAKDYHMAKRKLDIATYHQTDLTHQFNTLIKAKNPYTASCEQLAESYFDVEKQIKATDELLKELNETSSIYKYWVSAYKEIRLNLIDETLQELEIATNKHMQSLGLQDWQIEFRTEKENKSGTVTHSFNTLIYPNGQTAPIMFEAYSGGESQRLQLAVTAALSEILLDRAGVTTNIEILDEPSRHLSQEGIADLLECLRERAIDLRRCIYFIDHNSLESAHFDRIITIEKRQSGSLILS